MYVVYHPLDSPTPTAEDEQLGNLLVIIQIGTLPGYDFRGPKESHQPEVAHTSFVACGSSIEASKGLSAGSSRVPFRKKKEKTGSRHAGRPGGSVRNFVAFLWLGYRFKSRRDLEFSLTQHPTVEGGRRGKG